MGRSKREWDTTELITVSSQLSYIAVLRPLLPIASVVTGRLSTLPRSVVEAPLSEIWPPVFLNPLILPLCSRKSTMAFFISP